MKRNTIWIVAAILLIVALLSLPSLFYGRGGMMSGYNMMGSYGTGSNFMDQGSAGSSWANCGSGYGMMGGNGGVFGWLIPVIILVLVISGGVWLGNALSNRGKVSPPIPARLCPNCKKSVASDWKTCPYCGTSLE